MNFIKNKKGFATFEIVLFFGILLAGFYALYMLANGGFFNTKEMINVQQYEGVILQKYSEDNDDYTDYYFVVEGLNHEEITLSVSGQNYEAVTPGYLIKYVTYEYEGDSTIRYSIGTKDSVGTVILIANSDLKSEAIEENKEEGSN